MSSRPATVRDKMEKERNELGDLVVNCKDELARYYLMDCLIQETAIRKIEVVLKKTIKSIANLHGFSQCFSITDLGCSSRPNTLLAISNIINEVHELFKKKNLKPPQLQVCLNDLVGNDFNSVFKSLPMFYDNYNKEEGENNMCYVSVVPGSFHERLFPDQSRSNVDPSSNGSGDHVAELLGKSLVDAVNEGLVRESDLNSFNMLFYFAYSDEIRDIIHNQGSFSLDILESFEINLDPYDTDYENGKASD
ncbi:benzoate carboxyl methyltransferase-like protein [Tanacetum coccineum]